MTIAVLSFVTVILIAGSASFACAKDVDLRIRTDVIGEYNVAFCARPSPKVKIPGHMFVAFSKTLNSGERTFVALGHTVGANVSGVGAVWSYFSPVDGLLKEEMYTSIKQECLDVRVNQEIFNEAFTLTDGPLKTMGIALDPGSVLEEYSLGSEDCMEFAISVANTLKSSGLQVPERKPVELPMDYLLRLISAN